MALLPLAERLTRRALTAQGVRSRSIRTAIAPLHVYDAEGDGPLPTVVVLHGINSSGAAFAPLLARLRKRARRVLVPEAPGHGFSGDPTAPLTPDTLSAAMTELLDRELDEPAIVAGNSLGGGVALSYAIARPDRVRALVLTSPAGAAMDEADLADLLSTFKLRSRAEARAFMARLYARPPWFAPLLAGDVKKRFAREVITSFTASVRPEHGFTPAELASLEMPILLLWGRADRLMPPSNLEYFRRHLPPHARIEEPEDLGHCPHLDAPARLAATITSFAEEALRAGR
ncbi:MAG: alpha/beta hydrolase [Polyangiaceae bacterium]|nr:alpha/beta hydrolase [Polyangiaceae bacterium]